MNPTAPWLARPIFITSTFRDTHAERDWLRTRVFPELEERLQGRRCHLEPIDLRWGVETSEASEEGAKQLLVLKVCLGEVARSRPFLIGILGDRYGWVPPPERMEAATREVGFEKPVVGRSVTELEIDYGVLADSAQRRRCFFYLRKPLRYDEMDAETAALYREEPGSEPARRLSALKARLEAELPGRVRSYTAEWSAERGVTALEAWGQQVLEDLWSELEAETAERAQAAEPTWQEAERFTLEAFVEERTRSFVGRDALLSELTALAMSAAEDGARWGACVTSEAGLGKSALFAQLYRRLQGEDVLLLAHAAGVSPRSNQLDAMLRRWADELAEASGEPAPLAEDANAEEVEEAFRALLGRASAQRRVVVRGRPQPVRAHAPGPARDLDPEALAPER